ncbi:MAG TPA: hypothetical protein VGJ22_11100 [Anaerolineales bacterium]|jgi:hypothetical protein
MSPDLITGSLGFLFTVLIFSYLIGDNPLFRIVTYIFVGVAAGYFAAVAFWQVLWPELFHPLFYESGPQNVWLSVPLILIGLMLMKASPRTTQFGAPSMAFLTGVAAAVAIGGAVIGTLSPQALATVNAFDLRSSANPIQTMFNSGLILLGVVSTLAYFHFGGRASDDGSIRRFAPIEWIAWIGRIFIAITLGALFAGVYSAALTALVERLFALWDFIGSFI